MKKMTCKELGGACNAEFFAETFEEMTVQSRSHSIEEAGQGDADHIDAMDEILKLMKNESALKQWMLKMRKQFEAKPSF